MTAMFRLGLLTLAGLSAMAAPACACSPAVINWRAPAVVGRVVRIEPPSPTVTQSELTPNGEVTRVGTSSWDGTVTIRVERTLRWQGRPPPRLLVVHFHWGEVIEGCPSGQLPPEDGDRHTFLIRREAETRGLVLYQVVPED
jgi:hypothetical protein